jgi:hypothetical protein
VYEVDRDLAEVSLTAMFTFSASGMMCPPMLIYPYKRIPSEITHTIPSDWSMAYNT